MTSRQAWRVAVMSPIDGADANVDRHFAELGYPFGLITENAQNNLPGSGAAAATHRADANWVQTTGVGACGR